MQRSTITLVIFVLGLFTFRTAVADWNYVPSASMEPTLFEGDYLWVDKTSFGSSIPFLNVRLETLGSPERGDIITFVPPHTEKLFVKRVVGVPGDVVSISGDTLSINGKHAETYLVAGELVESLIGHEHKVQLSGPPANLQLSVVVPAEKYFVLGDNRNNSHDSRYWGFVSEDSIMGKGTAIPFSFSSARGLLDRFGLDVTTI